MTSELAYIRVSNYRAFDEPPPLELRPLTLLYGKNNAGKSTLVRLFGILSDSLSEEARGPFALDGAAGGGADFADVLFDRESGRFSFELGWAGADALRARWLLKRDDDGLTQVERLEVADTSARCLYLSPMAVAFPAEGDTLVPDLHFTGLIPDAKSLPVQMERLRDRLRSLRGRIQWISAVRSAPGPLVQRPAAVPTRLEPQGSDAAAALLVNARAREEVAGWYQRHCERELISEPAGGSQFRWRLPPIANPSLAVGLRDAGEGMTQVLPVLTAVAMRSTRSTAGSLADGSGLRIIAIEEPTTHLHDDLQIAMVQHLARVAREDRSLRLILETHARPMLLGVQLAIARGEVDEEDVGVWWIEQDSDGRSRYDRVRFDKSGAPLDDTLQHVFDDERRVMRELARKRLAGAGS